MGNFDSYLDKKLADPNFAKLYDECAVRNISGVRGDWIRADKLTPEDGQVVLAYCKKINKYFVGVFYGQRTPGYWRHLGAAGAEYGPRSKVTHWMSLPEAPEE